jgi:hypothetical protein
MTPSQNKIFSHHLRQLTQAMCEILGTLGVLHDYINKHELEPSLDHPIHHVGNAVAEMALSRAIEKFEVYSLGMARDILNRHLKIALSKSTKKIALKKLALVLDDPIKLHELLRDQAIENLSLSGLYEINEFFCNTLNIPIFSKDSAWWIGFLSANRNSIVHGDGSLDVKAEGTLRQFGWSDERIEDLRNTPKSENVYSPLVSGLTFLGISTSIMANACAADEKLCTTYGIPAVFSQEEYDNLVSTFLNPTTKK